MSVTDADADGHPAGTHVSFLTVTLGRERLGIEIGQVDRVLNCPPVTRVPGAPLAVDGAANVDGTVTAVVDLYRVLGRERGTGDILVLFDDAFEQGLGVRVDGAVGAVAVPVENIDPAGRGVSRQLGAEGSPFKAVVEDPETNEPMAVVDRDRLTTAVTVT